MSGSVMMEPVDRGYHTRECLTCRLIWDVEERDWHTARAQDFRIMFMCPRCQGVNVHTSLIKTGRRFHPLPDELKDK